MMKQMYLVCNLIISIFLLWTGTVFAGTDGKDKLKISVNTQGENIISLYITRSGMHVTLGHSHQSDPDVVFSANNATDSSVMLDSPVLTGTTGPLKVFDYMMDTYGYRIKQLFTRDDRKSLPVKLYIAAADIEGLSGAGALPPPDGEEVEAFLKKSNAICRSKKTRSEFFACMFAQRIKEISPLLVTIDTIVEADRHLMAAMAVLYKQAVFPGSVGEEKKCDLLMVHMTTQSFPYLVKKGECLKRTSTLPQEKEEKGGTREVGQLFCGRHCASFSEEMLKASGDAVLVEKKMVEKNVDDIVKAVYSDNDLHRMTYCKGAGKEVAHRGAAYVMHRLLEEKDPVGFEVFGDKVLTLAYTGGRPGSLNEMMSICRFSPSNACQQALTLVNNMCVSLLNTILSFVYSEGRDCLSHTSGESICAVPPLFIVGEKVDILEQYEMINNTSLSMLFLSAIQSSEYTSHLWQILQKNNFTDQQSEAEFKQWAQSRGTLLLQQLVLLPSSEFKYYLHKGAVQRLQKNNVIALPENTDPSVISPTPMDIGERVIGKEELSPAKESSRGKKRELSPEAAASVNGIENKSQKTTDKGS